MERLQKIKMILDTIIIVLLIAILIVWFVK
jgi:hypothetical protein|nr:MAG TPA: envelope protein [Caudoviricetes sp.]DAP70019.1 MAG TPA: envelope protein [Caudoviricetes sp.]